MTENCYSLKCTNEATKSLKTTNEPLLLCDAHECITCEIESATTYEGVRAFLRGYGLAQNRKAYEDLTEHMDHGYVSPDSDTRVFVCSYTHNDGYTAYFMEFEDYMDWDEYRKSLDDLRIVFVMRALNPAHTYEPIWKQRFTIARSCVDHTIGYEL